MNQRPLIYRPIPDFLKRRITEDIQTTSPTLNPANYSPSMYASVQRVNAILQDLQRREENARLEAERAQEMLRRNLESSFSSAEQARNARREALRQANEELQTQNRIRLRAMGGMPSSAVAELQARTEREMLRNFGNIDADYANKLAESENQIYNQFANLEAGLRNTIAKNEEERTKALRELEEERMRQEMEARAQAAANAQRMYLQGLLGQTMEPSVSSTSEGVLGESVRRPVEPVDNRIAEVPSQSVDFGTDLARRALDVLGLPGGYYNRGDKFESPAKFLLYWNNSPDTPQQKMASLRELLRRLDEKYILRGKDKKDLIEGLVKGGIPSAFAMGGSWDVLPKRKTTVPTTPSNIKFPILPFPFSPSLGISYNTLNTLNRFLGGNNSLKQDGSRG
jgi:hypothetical protein